MHTGEYIKKTQPKIFSIGSNKEILNAYAGDFLSFVMGRAKDKCIWFTVMNNINVAGVAVLIDCTCIVLCENTQPDQNLINKCSDNGITLLSTDKPVYEACIQFSLL